MELPGIPYNPLQSHTEIPSSRHYVRQFGIKTKRSIETVSGRRFSLQPITSLLYWQLSIIVFSEIVEPKSTYISSVIDINLTLNLHIQANEQYIIQDRRRFGVKYFHYKHWHFVPYQGQIDWWGMTEEITGRLSIRILNSITNLISRNIFGKNTHHCFFYWL